METLLVKLSEMPTRRRKLFKRLAISLAERRGKITASQADELRDGEWQDFLEWFIEFIIENGPEIMEFLIAIFALF